MVDFISTVLILIRKRSGGDPANFLDPAKSKGFARRIRRKLAPPAPSSAGRGVELLKTVRNGGYQLTAPVTLDGEG